MIGKPFWYFDRDHRVYVADDGTKTNYPVWHKHWTEWKVVGETSRSWIVLPARWGINDPTHKSARKIPKKGTHQDWCQSEKEIVERAWAHDHKYKIADRVQRLADPAILRKVAELVGYEPPASEK
jgi:hypothetical protein